MPPLLTTNPAGTPLQQAGLLNDPSTTVRFGGQSENSDRRSGGRATLGVWLDGERTLGVEGRFFILEGQGRGGAIGSRFNQAVAGRPFTDVLASSPASELVAFPDVLNGNAAAQARSSTLLGTDAVVRWTLSRSDVVSPPLAAERSLGYRLDVLAGYRFLAFNDSVRIAEDLQPVGVFFLPDTRIMVRDDFLARNRFHGGLIGLNAEVVSGRWVLSVSPRLGIGRTNREVEVTGLTSVSATGTATEIRQGGLLAQVSNIGRHEFSDWGVVPELDVNLGCRLTDHLRFLAGYTFLYWSDVARAGEQIDLGVNTNLVPAAGGGTGGPSRPAFLARTTGMWAQGLSLGMEVRY